MKGWLSGLERKAWEVFLKVSSAHFKEQVEVGQRLVSFSLVRRRRGQQRIKWLDGITDSMDMSLGGLGVLVKEA